MIKPGSENDPVRALAQGRHPDGGVPTLSIPGYEITEVLGAGNYGTVFGAIQSRSERRVAIKVARLGSDPRKLERFKREMALCARLQHPHVVQLLDEGRSGAHVYGIFEYVPGITLKQQLLRDGPMSAPETGRLMAEILDALACAHDSGVVHRDLKPENIMVATYGVVRHAKVLDFGISTLVPSFRKPGFEQLTLSDECLGTPAYSAPEQLRGEPPGVQADLYAWALIFLECLTGQVAMGGASAAEIFYQQLAPQEISLPKALANHPIADLLRRALRKKVSERSHSARELWNELSRIRLDDLVGVFKAPLWGPLNVAATEERSPLPEEKRQLTFLCCGVDVVEPGQGAEDFEAQELRQRQAFRIYLDEALRQGGVQAGTLGNRFTIMFGYPRSSESDPRQAALSAAALVRLARQRMRQAAPGAREDLRVGLHTGMVVITGGEVSSGQALNVVMQLENQAGVGEVLVSETCRQRLRDFGEFEAAGSLPAAAGSAASPCYRMTVREESAQGPVTDIAQGHAICIGRSPELRTLLAAWKHSREGTGQALVLRGEAGVGKSCLSETLRRHVARKGYRTLVCKSLPESENNALAPLLRLLRQWLDHVPAGQAGAGPTERLARALSEAGCETDRVLPVFCTWLSLPLPPTLNEPMPISPALQKSLLVQSAIQWLVSLSHAQPLLLIVEDLHWADSATLEWLEGLVAALPAERLMLLLTSRPGWAPPAGFAARFIEVQRLKSPEAALMVRHVLAPRRLAPEVVDNIVARTDGVALFIQELSRMLLETSLVERDGIWYFNDAAPLAGIPVTLRESLQGRFEHLGPARDILQLAATIGREFDLALLSACGPASVQPLEESLRILVDAGLLVKTPIGDGYQFRHALIRDAAYEGMLSAQRKRHHAAVAESMERLYPQRVVDEPGTLAGHFWQAGLHARAVTLGLAQLRLTQHRSLNNETIAYARQVDLWVDRLSGVAQLEARLELNGYVIQALMNKYGWANVQVAEKIALCEDILAHDIAPHLRVQHLWAAITYHHVASHRAEVMRLCLQLEAVALQQKDDDLLVAARMWLGLAHFSDGRNAEAEEQLSEAIDGYRPERHASHAASFGFDTWVWAKAGRALVRWAAGYDEAARCDAQESVDYARQTAHLPSLGMALLYQALGLQGRGDKDGARSVTEELVALALRHGLPAYLGYSEIILAWANDDVARADGAVQALWGMGCRYCQTYYRAFPAQTLAAKGQWTAALERLDDCLQLSGQQHEGLFVAELLVQKAEYLLQTGHPAAEIERLLRHAVDRSRQDAKYRFEAQALRLLGRLRPEELPAIQTRLQEVVAVRPELCVP